MNDHLIDELNRWSISGNVRVFGCANIYNATDMKYYCNLKDALAANTTYDGDDIQIPEGNLLCLVLRLINQLH